MNCIVNGRVFRYENEDDDQNDKAKQSKDYKVVDTSDDTGTETVHEVKPIKPGALISSAFTNIRTVHAYSMETWVS